MKICIYDVFFLNKITTVYDAYKENICGKSFVNANFLSHIHFPFMTRAADNAAS